MNKKAQQLGMSPGTASNRLVKNLLFHLAGKLGLTNCHKCGEVIERRSFSIEHKIPWIDSEEPSKLFFDLDNIAFSHLKCNIQGARKSNKLYSSESEANHVRYKRHIGKLSITERQARRRAKYLRSGH